MPVPIEPGLVVLQGNRLEMLRDVVVEWLGRMPIDPLDEESFVVQSTAAAEWLKRSFATTSGICAAVRFDLPGRFLWRAYRAMLGGVIDAAPSLDQDATTWRLMRLLPRHVDDASFAAVARYLGRHGAERRLSLARRLADLFDQYQVYRADWLAAWEAGRDVLVGPDGRTAPLPVDMRWQAQLWRALVAELSPAERRALRPRVHRAFVDALASDRPSSSALPARVVVFGAAYLNAQTLEALAALATRAQVLVAIPNPSRFHWADLIEGRELLRPAPQRLPSKSATPLATVSLDAMHLHAPPLLAAWGRQGRDFMRLLDAADDTALERVTQSPIEHFDDGPGETLLAQLQASIRDLVAPVDMPVRAIAEGDQSIVFRIAHGVQREVEVLHDALLALLAHGTLHPRDVIVMVPDIEVFAPSIRAVFGRYGRDDARRIPFDIADLRTRGSDPLVVALEWLLTLPDRRIGLGELRDLLEVPAAIRRAGIDPSDVPGLFEWLDGAGVRWGLDAAHRATLGLEAAGVANTWRFGLERMLLGYASGVAPDFEGIAPYDEVGGLGAHAVGALVALIERLERWLTTVDAPASPEAWASRCRALLADCFTATDDRERLTLAALQRALVGWLEACDAARFDEAVTLAVVREAWLGRLDGLDASRRFFGGGVTFCTLMPLRSVPFEVVCLLGMNDRDFPRAPPRSDFDLLAMPGQRRPGDRSRRDDDRYLMLEALLSARRTLYVGWSGRNPRDDTAQPPSVLVSQLRDAIASRWTAADGGDVLAALTVVHPLQPFSRRYFEGGALATYAREWRAAHADAAGAPIDAQRAPIDDDLVPTLDDLARFLKNPVRVFYERRLGVRVREESERADDDEPFTLGPLAQYQLRERLVGTPDDDGDGAFEGRLETARRSGALPLFARGDAIADEAAAMARAMRSRWRTLREAYPHALAKQPVRFAVHDLSVEGWVAGLRADGRCEVRVALRPSRLAPKGRARADKLRAEWVAMLAASACGDERATIVVGCDATLTLEPLERDDAAVCLADVLHAWTRGMAAPLPFAVEAAVAWVTSGERAAQTAYEGGFNATRSERDDFALRRAFPDFAALARAGFADWAERLFAPLVAWAAAATVVAHADTGADDSDEAAS